MSVNYILIKYCVVKLLFYYIRRQTTDNKYIVNILIVHSIYSNNYNFQKYIFTTFDVLSCVYKNIL